MAVFEMTPGKDGLMGRAQRCARRRLSNSGRSIATPSSLAGVILALRSGQGGKGRGARLQQPAAPQGQIHAAERPLIDLKTDDNIKTVKIQS